MDSLSIGNVSSGSYRQISEKDIDTSRDKNDFVVVGFPNGTSGAKSEVELEDEFATGTGGYSMENSGSQQLDEGLLEPLSGSELAKRTPWYAFFTTASSLTLLIGFWTNVRVSVY